MWPVWCSSTPWISWLKLSWTQLTFAKLHYFFDIWDSHDFWTSSLVHLDAKMLAKNPQQKAHPQMGWWDQTRSDSRTIHQNIYTIHQPPEIRENRCIFFNKTFALKKWTDRYMLKHMVVSINGGYPQIIHFRLGFSIVNHHFGVPPIYGNLHILKHWPNIYCSTATPPTQHPLPSDSHRPPEPSFEASPTRLPGRLGPKNAHSFL